MTWQFPAPSCSPDRSPARGEVRILDGRIEAVVIGESPGGAAAVIEAGDAYVLPGAVDAHVHCLSDPHEGIEAATRGRRRRGHHDRGHAL